MAVLALLHADPAAFSWTSWSIHPSVVAGCLLLAGAYLYAVGPLRRRFGWAAGLEPWRLASFVAAVVIVFVSLNGPIHDLSDYFLFSAHMVQHMLLMMLFPPLLLLGLPAWLLRPVVLRPRVAPVTRLLTHPVAAFVAYNVVLIGWHFPTAYNWALTNHDVHITQHLMFIGVAVLMWWPIVDPVPELARMSSMLKLLYLFAFGLPMSIVAAFITMAPDAVYPWYIEAPRIFGLSALEDQQLGGLLMWVPGMLIYWATVTIIFLRYSAREDQHQPVRPGERREWATGAA